MPQNMRIVNFDDGFEGASSHDRLVASYETIGDYTTPGSTVDMKMEWTVDRDLIGPDVQALMCRVKAKAKTSYDVVGEGKQGDFANFWLRAGTPAASTLNDMLYLSARSAGFEPQVGNLSVGYAWIILPIEGEKVWVDIGAQQSGAKTQTSASLFVEYGIIYDDVPKVPAVVFDGSASNFFSTPDAASLDITDNLEVIYDMALVDTTPVPTAFVVSKRGASSQFSWQISIGSSGKPKLTISSDGGTGTLGEAEATVAPTVANDEFLAYRVTFEAGEVNWYTSPSGDGDYVWTQLGTAVTTTNSLTAIHSGTADVLVGATAGGGSTGLVMNGSLRRLIIGNFGGAVAADWRPVPGNATTVDRTGKTWTATGSAWDWKV